MIGNIKTMSEAKDMKSRLEAVLKYFDMKMFNADVNLITSRRDWGKGKLLAQSLKYNNEVEEIKESLSLVNKYIESLTKGGE